MYYWQLKLTKAFQEELFTINVLEQMILNVIKDYRIIASLLASHLHFFILLSWVLEEQNTQIKFCISYILKCMKISEVKRGV